MRFLSLHRASGGKMRDLGKESAAEKYLRTSVIHNFRSIQRHRSVVAPYPGDRPLDVLSAEVGGSTWSRRHRGGRGTPGCRPANVSAGPALLMPTSPKPR